MLGGCLSKSGVTHSVQGDRRVQQPQGHHCPCALSPEEELSEDPLPARKRVGEEVQRQGEELSVLPSLHCL